MRGGRIAAVSIALVAAALIAPALAPAADWPTYGYSLDRSGFNPSERTIGAGNVAKLKRAWTARLGGLIDTQPVLASGVQVGAETLDLVYAGNENGRFVAANAADGRIVWSRDLGAAKSNCPDLPSYGVTGTAQIDRARGSVYVVSNGVASELDLANGGVKRTWPITDAPQQEHNWSALTLSHGILYVALAGLCDQIPYRGRIVAIDTVSGSPAGTWFVTGGADGPFGGGIWSFGGVSADPAGDIFTATGNSAGKNERRGWSEHVVRLTSALSVRSSNYPGVSGLDADFGATPLLYRAAGCPAQFAVGNKLGSFFVYNRDRIGRGPVQRIRLGGGTWGQTALIGVAAYRKRTVYVSNPQPSGRYKAGIVAFRVTKKCRLARRWNAAGPRKLTSSPTVANGVVYYGTGADGKVRALSATSGKRLATLGVGRAIFSAPSVVNGTVYAGSWDGKPYAFRLP